MSTIDQFRAAISAAGLTPPDDIQADGQRHRFSSSGKRGDDAGWYVLHDDARPAGAFGCWRSGVSATWKAENVEPFTPEQRREWAERRRQLEQQREQERQAATERAAATAQKMWSAAHDAADVAHDYLKRKQVAGIGARLLRDQLLIPMRHGPGALVGLQVIQQDGSRKFLTGTPAAGAYTVIGKPTPAGPIVICEGYATGVSIHMATGYCVVVAFSAGNLAAVTAKIRAALPVARLIIAADDDFRTEGNPGMTAAAVIGEPVAIPRWYGDRGTGTDFNDLHIAEGLRAVKDCIDAAEPIPPVTDAPDSEAPATDAPDSHPDEQPDQPASVGAPLDGANNSGSEPGSPSPSAEDAVDTPPATVPRGGDVIHAPDYIEWLPHTNDKGKPLATIENVAEICRRLNVTVRYNVISKEEELLIPGAGFSMDNRQNASLAWLISECARFRMPTDKVPEFITYLADRNLHNPVANWILSRPWDGRDYLGQLYGTVTAVGETNPRVRAMKETLIRKWMISAVAAAFLPNGVSAHGVLVFQGEQYLGKTKWFKSLVPAELGVLKDGMLLRPDDRDSVMKCVSNWLVELGEIDATFRKSDVAALKSFITSDRDVLRRAYARKESFYARRTVFFASVNPKNYLHDETGNRRYWTIECEALDHSHSIDMQQCWAQVYHEHFAKGATWFLSGDELMQLNDHNKEFEVIDPIEDLITNGLRWSDDPVMWNWRTATQVLVALGRQNCSKADVTRAGVILRKLNGDKSRRTDHARLLLVPETVSSRAF